jgi:hypothetical protein
MFNNFFSQLCKTHSFIQQIFIYCHDSIHSLYYHPRYNSWSLYCGQHWALPSWNLWYNMRDWGWKLMKNPPPPPPDENKQSLRIQSAQQGSRSLSLELGWTREQQGPRCVLIGHCWPGKLEVCLLEAEHTLGFIEGACLAFSCWSWVGNRSEMKETGCYWPSLKHSGPFPAEVVSQSSIFIDGVGIVCLYIY